MGAGDLTTLDNVKSWLNETVSDNDSMLRRLVTAASRFILQETNRPFFLPTPVSETRDGSGGDTIVMSRTGLNGTTIQLRRWPVLSLSSLTVDGQSIGVAPALVFGQQPGDGYILDPWDGTIPGNAQMLSIQGNQFAFDFGLRNVNISYVAGYQVSAEAAAVPTGAGPYTVTPAQPLGRWGSDGGVTYSSPVTALTKVTSNPGLGQYAVDATTGIYTFSAADAGASVLITYGFIPADIEQACIDLVAERYRYKDRVAVQSKQLGGQETVSFSIKSLPWHIASVIENYRTPVIG